VSSRLGTTGGPQVWDFTEGPTDEILRFDYLDPETSGYADVFPKAELAERLTNETDGHASWQFFTLTCEAGKLTYGYVDTDQLVAAEGVFTSPIPDFPREIKYGDNWSVGTQWFTTILGAIAKFEYTATSEVDAYGVIRQPEPLGFDDCLRVNEVSRWSTFIDFEADGNFTLLDTQYIRNYYWLRKNHGIAVQISSSDGDLEPPETFSTASAFVRQFELNHAPCEQGPQPVTDLEISLGSGKLLLNWSVPCFTGSFRIESTSNLADADSWAAVAETSQNFHFETLAQGAGPKYYRVVSLP
jgi:hypothetical protein